MKMVDDAFHSALHTAVPANNVVLSDVQFGFSGACPGEFTAVLQYQDVLLKHMKQAQNGASLPEDTKAAAALHNLQKGQQHGRTIVDMPDA